ncbi:MAG TPA: hypothetical protein VNF04_11245 [Stellaceae bacterium]|nr:hypothetical protein [Stellaceae bacterium]
MPNESVLDDTEIIHSAYAERVREVFRVFADNLSVGENEKLCRDRFVRSLDMVRRARDLALQAASGSLAAEWAASEVAEQAAKSEAQAAAGALSAEDQAMVDKVLSGTTGAAALRPLNPGALRPRR